ncbi:succinylglutamate desuccinylase/aspartoacylase family protein [Aureitalea sp. L0-47]|uniref:succinylglutamate desuccinylase/aspartoacylase family protein n=1 Tax=Aureitalea sp. L0-47 TaxID=2816962 RepID=UPI0022385090|nr:succinylglutamate desuccinylase/aspartoacylase family protein [Aureitalea sp. L0-47]
MTAIRIHSKPLNKTIEVNRLIGSHKGNPNGPTLIFTGGIHGNEPAGVFALKSVLEELKQLNPEFNGNLYAISGNLSALEKGVRYNKADLNRMWTKEKLAGLEDDKVISFNDELVQQKEIFDIMQDILSKEKGPYYFFDLHTTSGETAPFITVNDSLINRKFTSLYPVPLILGIEEFLDGPLLSYINELGYVAFGFEGGQHDSPKSIEYCRSFIYLTLSFTGCLSPEDANEAEHLISLKKVMNFRNKFFEIIYREEIEPDDKFIICDGYLNFQKVPKGTIIAINNGKQLETPYRGYIFMPLYQGKGNDGFFIIRKTPVFFLKLSAFLRKISFDRLLVALPGVNWRSETREELVVDLKIARFFTRKFFHLMGYRSKQKDSTHLKLKNREAVSKGEDYKNAPWNK